MFETNVPVDRADAPRLATELLTRETDCVRAEKEQP
jgi:hypothetical protein